MKTSILVPLHNEQENIVDLINTIEDAVDIEYELILIDDHSEDATAVLMRQLSTQYTNIRCVVNCLQCGFANALKTGFSVASGEVIVPIMGDLCDDLSSLRPMLDKINDGYDVVCASRYCKGGARLGGSFLKGFLSRLAGISINFFLGIPTRDIANAFKMYRKRIVDCIHIESQGFEISMELPLKAFFLGYRLAEVPTVWRERTRGKSCFRMVKLLPSYLKLYGWAYLEKYKGCVCRYFQ